jgi:hypothetical protein
MEAQDVTTIIATAEFTEDMAETLQSYFAAYQRVGVVKVEVTDRGLWLFNPHSGTRQFLGSARILPSSNLPEQRIPGELAKLMDAS